MKETINSAEFTEMLLCASDALELNKQLINELNVFPVPDGDTGTNMSLTMGAAAAELRKKRPQSVTAVADLVASSLLRGARGNSGVILSLLFRGLSKGLKGHDSFGAADFAHALAVGVEAAYKAVMKPAEGTVLTVSRLAAAAAVDFCKTGTDMELLLVCALEAAKDALANTINLNPVLKRAGVVDAGGKGYVIILEAMLASLQGRTVSAEVPVQATSEKADFSDFHTGEITFGYCTEFIVRKEHKKALSLLRNFLESLGDSVVVVEDDEIIKVHVHTDDPGQALTEALTYGPLLTVKVENMREQHDALSGDSVENSVPATPEKPFGIVTVCAGAGLESLFRELGADGIVTGGQTMNPSTEDILKEIQRTPAETVFVLPNNKNIIMAAEQCIPLTEKKVIVIPTKTVPQGVSALLSFDPDSTEEELTASMTEMAACVRTAQVTYAARDSDFDGHEIHAGEYLGLLDSALLGSFPEPPPLLEKLCTALVDSDPAILTVYYGADVTEADAQAVSQILTHHFPKAEVNIINGGQPVYYYLIAAE